MAANPNDILELARGACHLVAAGLLLRGALFLSGQNHGERTPKRKAAIAFASGAIAATLPTLSWLFL